MKKNEKKPIFKKWWFWCIMVLVLCIIGGVSGGVVGGGSNTSSSNNGEVEKNQSVEYKMNDTVSVGKLDFTITMAYNTVQISYLGTITQNNYVVVTMTVKNKDKSQKNLYESAFTYYRGKNSYKPHNDGIYLDNGFWVIKEIGAGITSIIQVVYEIPSTYESTDYILVKDGLSSKRIYMK